jgi:uncharacterized membrane protein YgcG
MCDGTAFPEGGIMKKPILKPLPAFLLVLAFFWMPGVQASAHAQERITRFESVVEIAPDGWLDVTETIAVEAEGQEIKRGIFRDFPVVYKTLWGLKRTVDFEVLEVLRDGKKEPWVTNDTANPGSVRVYIGDSNRMLPHGVHVYTLRYRTNKQLFVGQEWDELYWNVTGNNWAFPIEQARSEIRMPQGAQAESVSAYTGRQGEKGDDYRVVSRSEGLVIVETTKPLGAEEGLTVSVTWPKGFVADDANPENFATLAQDNFWLLAGAAFLAVVFFYYFAVWVVIGRDPPRGTIIAQYSPPDGFTPSAVRFVNGLGKFDDRSFGAAVLQLAVAGALRIEKNGVFALLKTDKEPDLLPGQQKFCDALFADGPRISLEQKNHATLGKAKEKLRKWLAADFEKQYFLRNSGWWFFGIFLSLVPAGLSLLQAGEIAPALFMIVWLSIWTVGVSAMLSTIISGFRAGKYLSSLPLALFSLPFIAGWFFGVFMLLMFTSIWVVGIFIVGAVMNAIFYHLLKAPTLEGRQVMDLIEGFRHYLSVAEVDRLDSMAPPQRTPRLFEKFLPYALALDVEQKWAEQFADVLAATSYKPEWCSGSGFATFHVSSIGSTFGSSMVSSLASASTAPGSSSGSGGGGSSGGGGGGGGGGGW